MFSYQNVKTISVILLAMGLFLITGCAQGTGLVTEAVPSGPTWTPKLYVAGTADATLPSFGWSGGVGGALEAPADCTGEGTSATEITISWTIPAELTGQSGFRVYQGVESLEEEIADPTAVTFVIGDLAASTQYHLDVRAYTDAGESTADSCAIDVTTLQ
jgi:hypothetical protein